MRQLLILGFLLISLIFSSFFIRLPYTISCSGKILPAREWIVRNVDGGDIMSLFNNHISSTNYDFTDFKFERGDIAYFKFNDEFLSHNSVKEGDTIGSITSFILTEKLIQLKNSLNEEYAYLKTISTGEKVSLVESAKNQYTLAKQEFDLQERNYERQKKLFEKAAIPEAEYDIAVRDYELAKTNIELAKNNQLTIETGAKPELVNYSNVKINSIINEIEILEQKLKHYTLIAPFNGKIVTKKVALNNPEALTYHILHIIDTAEYVVLLPIELYQQKYITKNISIEANLTYGSMVVKGSYIVEDQDVELAGNYKQVFIVKGYLKSTPIEIPYGIYAPCTINCGKVSLFEYIKRKLKV